MNIFEENKKKYEIKSKGDMVKMGFVALFAGGLTFSIGLPLSFIIIGIPLVIGGVIAMAIGGLLILAAPFWNPNRKVKSFREAWADGKERDKKLLTKVKHFVRK